MTEIIKTTPNLGITYVLNYQRRNSLKITLDENGRVLAYVPRTASMEEINRFVEQHDAWIKKHRVKVLEQISIPYCDAAEQKRRTVILKTWASSFLEKYDGKKPTRISVKNMSGRWGSCGSNGVINLTVYLLDVEEPLREYVMYHELAHLYYMDHSQKFWNQVGLNCPDYQAKRKALQRYRLPKKPS